MRSAEERKAMLEELLQRVKRNRANLEQARLAEPVEDELIEPEFLEPEPILLEPIEPEPIEPEPIELEPIEPEPIEPEPIEPEVLEPEPVERERAAVADSEELLVEVKTDATAPVAVAEGSRPRQWTIEAVLQRAWDLGSRDAS